jgi:hypothetical protein
VDLENQGPLDMESLEKAFDRTVMLLQQMKVEVDAAYIGSNWRGTWATSRLYEEKDMAYMPTGAPVGWYFCNTSHTSDVLADDVAAGYWTIAIDPADVTTGEPALGNPDVSGKVLSSTTAGVRSWIDNTWQEPVLGNPDVDGMTLVSTAAGVRSWGFPVVEAPSAGGQLHNKSLPLYYDGIYQTSGSQREIETTAIMGVSTDGTDYMTVPAGTYATGITASNVYFYVYLVRLVSTGATTLAYSSGGLNPGATYSATRRISLLYNNSSGYLCRFWQREGKVSWLNTGDMPVLTVSTTTAFVQYDPHAVIPTSFIDEYEFVVIATGACTVQISFDGGSTTILTLSFTTTALQQNFSVPAEIARSSNFVIKHATLSVVIKFKSITLR